MRNSRKYINPSINGSRNIFTSYDEFPDAFNITNASGLAGIETSTNTITISGLTVPVYFRVSGSAGTYHASSYCKIFKNDVLVQTINTPTSFSVTNVNESFYNGDTLKFAYYVDFSQVLAYTMSIFRYRYTISNPLTATTPAIDTLTISLS